jgi:hypothetical protein
MTTTQNSTLRYSSGQRFMFVPGQAVICNGYHGTVQRMYRERQVEVRVPGGITCTVAGYPDCYPDPDASPTDFFWQKDPDHRDRTTLFGRTGREFISIDRRGAKWIADTGQTYHSVSSAKAAMERWALWRLVTEGEEQESRRTAFNAISPMGRSEAPLQ